MSEPMTDADLERIEGLLAVGAIEVVYGRERDPDDVKMLVAEVRRLRDAIREHDRRYTLDGGGRARCYPVMGELLTGDDDE